MNETQQPNWRLALLPWLRIEKATTVGQMTLTPFRRDHQTDDLNGLAGILNPVLGQYKDNQGRPIKRCTVLVIPDRRPCWSLSPQDGPAIDAATSLAFLAAATNNGYYGAPGQYVNSSYFQVHLLSGGERYSRAITTRQVRKRDGFLPSAAPNWTFQMPAQVHACGADVQIDTTLLNALNALATDRSKERLFLRICTSSRFLFLANSDDDAYTEETELVLLGAAFEILLGKEGAYCVSSELGDLFRKHQRVEVREAVAKRPGIRIKPEHRCAEEAWALHRKWLEELHQQRSKIIHGEHLIEGKWGGSPHEHLVMGAFVFPLAVKILLRCAGLYRLTREDEARCRAVDRILSVRDWEKATDRNGNAETAWHQAISGESLALALESPSVQDQDKGRHLG